MKNVLITTVVILFLWSTTSLTAQASSILQTRSFRTNLIKGEYVEAEAEETITDPEEIEEPKPQESDEHTDVPTPTDMGSAVDDGDGELDQLEEPTQSQLDASDNTRDSTEPEVETPIDCGR